MLDKAANVSPHDLQNQNARRSYQSAVCLLGMLAYLIAGQG